MATQAKTNGTSSSADWPSHIWSSDSVYAAVTKSTEIIKLVCKSDEVIVSVHRELLCVFSTYYRAALKGNFAESGKDSLQVDLSSTNLKIFVTWIYTGHLPSVGNVSFYSKLYIFADLVDILALRRTLMSLIQKNDGSPPRYALVQSVSKNLPESSPLRKWVLDVYINHWEPNDDVGDPYPTESGSDPDNELAKFMYQVARGVAVRDCVDVPDCQCCNGIICIYHEHESKKEWEATCGTIEDLEMPSDLD